jgi:hypothetical protein
MPDVRSVESGAEWFSMIMSYLKVKSLVLWLQLHPESTYEEFENAWPFLLDQMMYKATNATIERLQTNCQGTLN